MREKVMIHSRITRILHWVTVGGLLFLITSGFYIHYPVNLGDVYNMKNNMLIQTTVGFFTGGVFLVTVYYNIVTGAYKEIWFKWRDFADFIGLMKYYLFLENKPPFHGKYNSGQRLIFSSWVIVFSFLFMTGLMLYFVGYANYVPISVDLQTVRFYHFLGALWFVGTIPIHIYLVLVEDPGKLQAIFTGWVKK